MGAKIARGTECTMATTTAAHTILNGAAAAADWKSRIPEQYWEIIDRYRPELLTQAQAILNNPEDAEDVVQETFCDAIREPGKLAHADSVGAWLKSLNRCNALNRRRDTQRSSKRLQAVQQMDDDTFTTGGFTMMELRDSVGKALVVLPPNLQSVVKLRYWEHLSCKDIAARLRIPEGSVKRMQAVQQLDDDAFTTGGFTMMELRESVGKAMVVLPPNLQTVVKLRYWEHLSCKDIAARLRIPEGSIKRMLFEANNKLYDRLKAQFEKKAATRQHAPAQVKEILAGE